MSFIHAGLTQDKPQLTLTVNPESSVFTGDTVTLSCDVGQLTGWTIHWIKDSNTESTGDATKTIESVSVSDEGRYQCRAQRGEYYSEYSNEVKITVRERPKPVARVDPDRLVFRGETVTLTCDIQQTGDWRYSWNKDGNQVYSAGQDKKYKISSVYRYHSGVYSCRGTQSKAPTHSQMSDGVTLTVSDLPRSTLTVTPDSPVFTGETVTLTCVIKPDHSDWRYEWNKDSVMLQSSDRHTVNRDTLTIRGATESDQGQYWCRGQRDKRPKSSQSSSAVSLSVKDSPRSTLTVTPDSPVFTGETVTLKCVIETHSNWRRRNGLTYDWRYEWTPEWRCEWYKGSVMLQTSDGYSVNRDTLTISAATESDQGQYWCRGQRDERPQSSQSSSAVSLSVTDLPRSTLTVTPDRPEFPGETINLTCVIESDHSDWRYEWFKDSVMLQTSDGYTVNRDTLTIRGVNESDQGQYWCRGQRDGRPSSSQESNQINLSDNVSRSGQISVFSILSFLLAACPYLLSTVVLLFRCCRARVTSTEDYSQYSITDEQTST